MTLDDSCFQGAKRERRLLLARRMQPAYQRPKGGDGVALELDDGMARGLEGGGDLVAAPGAAKGAVHEDEVCGPP